MTVKSIVLLPADYSLPPSNADFLSMPKAGESIKFTFVDSIITGYSYWTNDKKCIRSSERFTTTPGIKDKEVPKHFWAAKVWDYASKSVKILEIAQRGLQESIIAINTGDDYDLTGLDVALKITAQGEGLNKKYTLLPLQVRDLSWHEDLESCELYSKDITELLFAVSQESESAVEVEGEASATPKKKTRKVEATDMM
jgi:hypothetical protein